VTRTWIEEAKSALTPQSAFDEALRRKAALVVCDAATDVEDARDLLWVLGLVEEA
jgi:hypothetical protein